MPKYPYKPDEKKRSRYIQIKLTPEEEQRIKTVATRLGRKQSSLVREVFFQCLDGVEAMEKISKEFQHIEVNNISSPS